MKFTFRVRVWLIKKSYVKRESDFISKVENYFDQNEGIHEKVSIGIRFSVLDECYGQ